MGLTGHTPSSSVCKPFQYDSCNFRYALVAPPISNFLDSVVSDILRTFVLRDYRLPIQSDEIEKVILRTLLSMAQAFRKHRP